MGGQFPAADEWGPLRPYIGTNRGIKANRGYKKYDALSAIYGDDPATTQQYLNDPNAPTVGDTYSPQANPNAQMGAVPLTDIPTSSTNYSRPRTVAAGYDPGSRTMTVVFRDGTFYNYYDVTPGEWENFSASYSKGTPWLNKGFPNGKQKFDGLFIGKRHEPADVTAIDPAIREALYRVSRTQQIYQRPKPNRSYTYTDAYGNTQRRTAKSKGTVSGTRRTGYNPGKTQSSTNVTRMNPPKRKP